jgi:cobyrinic acid a,c-diamide synthase
MGAKTPRVVIAGLSGDSGKTIVTMSLMIALRRNGYTVVPFKKGPDYIDSAWLGNVSDGVCRNLDTYLVGRDDVLQNFALHSAQAEIAVIEGNRGLFDGKDLSGTHSTAELAKLLQAPLLLVVDATKSTRTVAALVKGCQVFDRNLHIAGVILNKVAGPRHDRILRESIEDHCRLPVVGSIPKLGKDPSLLPGRHLGLVPPAEYQDRTRIEDRLAKIADRHLDIEQIIGTANNVEPLEIWARQSTASIKSRVKIGYFKDSVFTFYYPENLEALEKSGASLIPISSLVDAELPEIDALYIGGGFPETHAELLSKNQSLMESVKSAAEKGLPIYAECGGLIYLCRSLEWHQKNYAMAGLFPIDLEMHDKPAGHGYMSLLVDQANPFYSEGTVIKGHEFHYSQALSGTEGISPCMKVQTGVGLGDHRDGLVFKNTLACYAHIHADGTKEWATAMIANALKYAADRQGAAA